MSELKTKEKIEDSGKVAEAKEIQSDNQEAKNKKSIVSKIFTVLAWIIIAVSIVIMIRALVFKKYDVFGCKFRIIMSGSMEPTIHVMDVVVTRESKEYNVGDIIAYDNGGMVSVHRLINKTNEDGKNVYIAQGDNNNAPDIDPVFDQNIEGRVVTIIPKVGNIALFTQKNLPIILIILAGGIIIITLIRRLIR